MLGVEPEDIRIVGGDSDITPFDWGAFSQRGTFTTGNAVKLAAEDARAQLAGIVGANGFGFKKFRVFSFRRTKSPC